MTTLGIFKPSIRGLGIAILLSGCATPKPDMPFDMYDQLATAFAGVERCGISGQLSPDAALWAKRLVMNKAAPYNYNPAYLDGRYKVINPGLTEPSADACNYLAMMAEQYKQGVQEHNAVVEANSRAWNQVQYTQPVHTYCNQIGAQTFCNSY